MVMTSSIQTTTLHLWYDKWGLSPINFACVYKCHHDPGAAELPEGVHLCEHRYRGPAIADLLPHLLPPPLHLDPRHRWTRDWSKLIYAWDCYQAKHTSVTQYFATETQMINFQKTCWQRIATFMEHTQLHKNILSVILKVHLCINHTWHVHSIN